jgi:acetylornithine deacetylase/succinyl-diaminopimelate desuccinylase-like protein
MPFWHPQAAFHLSINELLTGSRIKTTILARTPERPNLIARLSGQGNAPPLLLYGHVDVVITENQKCQHPPFEGKIADGFIWGRGALDMKGGIAMMLAVWTSPPFCLLMFFRFMISLFYPEILIFG